MIRPSSSMFVALTAVLISSALSQSALSAPTDELNAPAAQVSAVEQEYAGANQCFICHRPQTNTWSETKHSHAFTEVAQQYLSDPGCLKCHVTGFDKPNGFVADTTKDLSMVGCESCHGPGAQHIDAAQRFVMADPGEEEKVMQEMKDTIVKTPTDSACGQCHKPHENHPAYAGQSPDTDHASPSCGCNPALAVALRSSWSMSERRSVTHYSIKTCGGCHYDQYKHWSTGQHAQMSAMLPAKYISDQSCQTCHSSDSLVAITLASETASHAVGAACETCHGPGLDHINFTKQFILGPRLGPQLEATAREAIHKGKPESTCVQCHLAQGHKVHPDFEKQ